MDDVSAVGKAIYGSDPGNPASSAGVARTSILAEFLAYARAAYPQRRSSNANSLQARIRLDSRKSVRPFKEIICVDVSEIAVGTLITERPPHRTVRAQFGHTAPTLGV
jgi:hypothetical protein